MIFIWVVQVLTVLLVSIFVGSCLPTKKTEWRIVAVLSGVAVWVLWVRNALFGGISAAWPIMGFVGDVGTTVVAFGLYSLLVAASRRGGSLSDKDEMADADEYECSECGADLPADGETCPRCGADVREIEEDETRS